MFLLLAFSDQLSKTLAHHKLLTSSLLGAGVTGRSASLLLPVPGLFTVDSAQGVGLVVTTTHGRSSLGLYTKKHDKHRDQKRKERLPLPRSAEGCRDLPVNARGEDEGPRSGGSWHTSARQGMRALGSRAVIESHEILLPFSSS